MKSLKYTGFYTGISVTALFIGFLISFILIPIGIVIDSLFLNPYTLFFSHPIMIFIVSYVLSWFGILRAIKFYSKKEP